MTKIEVALEDAREGNWIEGHLAGRPERVFQGVAWLDADLGELFVGSMSVRRIDGKSTGFITVTRITREVPDLPTDPDQYFTATADGEEGVLLKWRGPDVPYPYRSMGAAYDVDEIDPTTVQLVDIVPRKATS